MKPCFVCKQNYELDGFYKHPQMPDGHLNKCIGCCKLQAEQRRLELEVWLCAKHHGERHVEINKVKRQKEIPNLS